MSYHQHSLKLLDGRKTKLAKAYSSGCAVTLRLKYENLRGNDEMLLTKTQISRIRKSMKEERGMDLTISKTQIRKVIPHRGSLFLTLIGLIGKPALGALASGGLSFGVDKSFKGIFGSGGYGPKEVK